MGLMQGGSKFKSMASKDGRTFLGGYVVAEDAERFRALADGAGGISALLRRLVARETAGGDRGRAGDGGRRVPVGARPAWGAGARGAAAARGAGRRDAGGLSTGAGQGALAWGAAVEPRRVGRRWPRWRIRSGASGSTSTRSPFS